MAAPEISVRRSPEGDVVVGRLVCHPRLPLVAALDSRRPAVHLWDVGRLDAPPRYLACIDDGAREYEAARSWDEADRTPAVSWDPYDPLLLVAVGSGLLRWTPDDLARVEGAPHGASYRSVAVSPDGRTAWVSPASDGQDRWRRSEAIDLRSGAIATGPRWDTDVIPHPGGDLVMTLQSDQGATLVRFARIDGHHAPATLCLLRRALVLDCDGYELSAISPDGRQLAVRGNAYDNSLQVFEFPSLRRVVATTLGDPLPPHHTSPDWLERQLSQWLEHKTSWPWHAVAFARPGVLLLGTPSGTVIELDVASRTSASYELLPGERVTALAVAATSDVLVAGSGTSLAAVRGLGTVDPVAGAEAEAARQAAAFLAATGSVPHDADPWDDLDLTHAGEDGGDATWVSLTELVAACSRPPGDPHHREPA